MTTLEGNKLIAEFMGATSWVHKLDGEIFNLPGAMCGYMTKELKYHSYWDWLMPVGKKVRDILTEMHEKMPKHTANKGDLIEVDIMCRLHEYDIEKTWQHIVEFITWYNQQGIKIKR